MDIAIAKEVFGHEVKHTKKCVLEKASTGDRPLRAYSKEMAAAWAVVEKLNITLLPIENDEWFALVGESSKRWSGPAEFMAYLQTGKFVDTGAAVGAEPAFTICMAALKAMEHRKKKDIALDGPVPAQDLHLLTN